MNEVAKKVSGLKCRLETVVDKYKRLNIEAVDGKIQAIGMYGAQFTTSGIYY